MANSYFEQVSGYKRVKNVYSDGDIRNIPNRKANIVCYGKGTGILYLKTQGHFLVKGDGNATKIRPATQTEVDFYEAHINKESEVSSEKMEQICAFINTKIVNIFWQLEHKGLDSNNVFYGLTDRKKIYQKALQYAINIGYKKDEAEEMLNSILA